MNQDMKAAMRSRDEARLSAIRMLWAAIQRREVDERITLDDTQVLSVVEKTVRQSRDAVEQFLKGNRPDLADKENRDIAFWEVYLPAQASDDEVAKLVREAIATTGAASIKDMGKVVGVLKPQLQGRADMGKVSALVKAQLAG
ncbi:MAG: GatB/YqeY domain-containing protein [Pseudomonadota bacterium]